MTFPGSNQHQAGRVYDLCVYFRTGDPKGLTESGSGELGFIVCGRVPWLYQYWPGGFMLFVVLCPGTPGGSTSSGSGFKASQKTGQMA